MGQPARPGAVVAAVASFAVVAGLTGVVTYLATVDRGENPPSAGAAGQASPPPSQSPLTAADIYHTSPWPYDMTFDDGNRITGELELIETYDHPDCVSAGLTEAVRIKLIDCTHRMEAAYRGTIEGTVVSEQVLVFTDTNAAAAFRGRFEREYAGDLLAFRDPSEIQDAAPWRVSWIDGVDRYAVVTVVFGQERDQQGGDDVAARNRESVQYLTTRGS